MKTQLISLAALALFAGAAHASPIVVTADSIRAEHVSVADLNLHSKAGTAALEARLRNASRAVCSTEGDDSLDAFLVAHSCYVAALSDGLRQARELSRDDNPTVAAARIAITGR